MNRRNAQELCEQTLAMPREERQAFLEHACGDDEELRDEVIQTMTRVADDGASASLDVNSGDHIGPYRIIEAIGEGGMGTVFLAQQTEPVAREVALKVVKLGMDTREVLARFDAERQALARMSHPNIAAVFDAGATEAGRPYFAMEYVRGVPITDYCDRRSLDIEARLQLFQQACDGIQHAHDKDLIHRDLKPSNILVAEKSGRPVVKIIDFGVAKSTHAKLTEQTLYTRLGAFIGTPNYASPEQAQADELDLDSRSDVYSLGVLLYELLVGKPPFDRRAFSGKSLPEIQHIIQYVDPPTPYARFDSLGNQRDWVAQRRSLNIDRVRSRLKGELAWIVLRAMEKDRDRRYSTASALAEDLDRFLRHLPVEARRPSALYRARKFLRRTRIQTSVAIVVGALIIGILWLATDRIRPPPVTPDGASSAPGPAASDANRSIAVLPFSSLSNTEEDAYLALGLHDETLSQLAQVTGLRVISRTSVMRFRDAQLTLPDIASELGVNMLLEGTVKRVGERARINLKLFEGPTERLVWEDATEFDVSAEALHGVQQRITRNIARVLGLTLSAAENAAIDQRPTASTEAYDAYLRGRSISRYGDVTEADLIDATEFFDQAIASDPLFAEAYAAKADALLSLYWSGRERQQNLQQARVALDRAVALKPRGVETLAILGIFHYRVFLDYDRAETLLEEVVNMAPGHTTAWTYRAAAARRSGRFDAAAEAFRRGLELDPLRSGTWADLIYTLALTGDFVEARQLADRARRMDPTAPYLLGAAGIVGVLEEDLDYAWNAVRNIPVIDSGAYDFFRTQLTGYLDHDRLRELMDRWPEPRIAPPFLNYLDTMRAIGLDRLGEHQASLELFATLRQRVEQELSVNPMNDENRKIIVAIYGFQQDQEALTQAVTSLLENPPRDRNWLLEEGFVIIFGLAAARRFELALEQIEQIMTYANPAFFARVRLSPYFDDARSLPRYAALEARYENWLASR